MKHFLLPLGAALLLSACASVRVTDTQTAAVVTERPKSIYIRPFSIAGAEFTGHQRGGPGERPIRESLAPAEFSNDLREELELLAPALVLAPDDVVDHGWIVEGHIDVVDAGSPTKREFTRPGGHRGESHIAIHVRVIDLDHGYANVEDKSEDTLHRHGRIIYEFDVAGGSRGSGKMGTIKAPGLGYAVPFDYRNAAERIRAALEPDPHRYGARSSTTIP